MPQPWVDQLVLWCCCAAGPLLWLAVVLAGYLRERTAHRRRRGGCCLHCGYDTHGLPRDTGHCPECGRELGADRGG